MAGRDLDLEGDAGMPGMQPPEHVIELGIDDLRHHGEPDQPGNATGGGRQLGFEIGDRAIEVAAFGEQKLALR
ncbi:hypothetical protein, partial [Enterobacter hormaechei]|uniref:hypothetical protein n=1 Tax=Enterobacter hormaechei TaxID=158836 RepID=UPI0013D8878E